MKPVPTQVSIAVRDKGEALVADGRVERVGDNRYLVHSASGKTYYVHNGLCRCLYRHYQDKAVDEAERRVCSHAYAAMLQARLDAVARESKPWWQRIFPA